MDFLLGLLFFISLSVFGGSVVLLIVSIFSTSMRKDRRLYLILLVISLIVSIVSLVIAASNTDTEDMDNTTNMTEVTNPQLSDDTAEITSIEYDLSNIETCVKNNLGENELLKDITLENDDLRIYIDFSNVDPSPLTLEDIALARTSSITDAILEKQEYDILWNTITIDYGEIGYIRNSKENITDNGYGRFFPMEQFSFRYDTNK